MNPRSEAFLSVFGYTTYDKLLAMAADPATAPEYIELMVTGGDELVWAALVQNPTLSEEQLLHIGKHSSAELVRAIANHPNCPTSLGVFLMALKAVV